MKNLMEISFLKEDIEEILNNENINKQFQKIMSMYSMMNVRDINIINYNYDDDFQISDSKNRNEITLNQKKNNKNSRSS